DGQQVDVAEAAHRRRSRAIAHQRDLAEALAGPERAQARLAAVRVRLQHLDLAIDDHVEPVPTVALAEDHLPWLEVLAADADRLVGLELHDIGAQDQIERPVRGHANLPVEPGELHQIYGPPQPPGEEARDLQAEDLGHRRVVPERPHLAERVERERAPGPATQARHGVPGDAAGLA